MAQSWTINSPEDPKADFTGLFKSLAGQMSSHHKGLSEWLKNSHDHYQRTGRRASERKIHLAFSGADLPRQPARICCFDYGGMPEKQVRDAFSLWFSTEAAKWGQKTKTSVLGGHGNGGKLYMLALFRVAYVLTRKKGKLSSWGMMLRKKGAYWKHAFGWRHPDVMLGSFIDQPEYAWIVSTLPAEAVDRMRGRAGFTLVVGEGPLYKPLRAKPKRLRVWSPTESDARATLEALGSSPQARTPLKKCHVDAHLGGGLLIASIVPPEPKLHEDWRDLSATVLRRIPGLSGFEGQLTLKVSKKDLGEDAAVSFENEAGGSVASYNTESLVGVTKSTLARKIYGTVEIRSLGDLEPYVANDRAHFRDSPGVRALLRKIRDEVGTILESDKEQKLEKAEKHRRNVIAKDLDYILRNPPTSMLGGGANPTVVLTPPSGKGEKERPPPDKPSDKKRRRGGSNSAKGKGRFGFEVLLSGIDRDPEGKGTFHLGIDDRLFYQRPIDKQARRYWLNMDHPYSRQIPGTAPQFNLRIALLSGLIRALIAIHPEKGGPAETDLQEIDEYFRHYGGLHRAKAKKTKRRKKRKRRNLKKV